MRFVCKDLETLTRYALLATAFSITFSIALAQVTAVLLLLLCTLQGFRGRVRSLQSPILWGTAVFIAVALLSVVFGVDPVFHWKRVSRLFWFLLIPAVAATVRTPDRLRSVAAGLALGGGVLALDTLIRHPWKAAHSATGDSFLTRLVNAGSMTDGQMLMLAIVAATAFAMAAPSMRRRGPWLGLLGLLTLAMVVNFKRGSWFCTVLLLVALVLQRRTWRYALLALGLAGVVALLPPVRARLAGLGAELDAGRGGRLTMWTKVAPALIREYPGGIGYGGMTSVLMRQVAPNVEPGRNHLHSNPAQILVETGWAGLAVWLLWMGAGVQGAIRLARREPAPEPGGPRVGRLILLMLAGLLLNGLVEYNFGDAELVIVYAILLGGVAGTLPPLSEARPVG